MAEGKKKGGKKEKDPAPDPKSASPARAADVFRLAEVTPHMEKAKKAAEAAWLAIPRASHVPATLFGLIPTRSCAVSLK